MLKREMSIAVSHPVFVFLNGRDGENCRKDKKIYNCRPRIRKKKIKYKKSTMNHLAILLNGDF